ncbi:MAG TPA: ATP-binding protein, partial [Xylanibacter oryzae]|nr:ATP-binding protein [Xylanibacter oryzae]
MPPSDTCICIDREAITKVISNLLNNAAKYARRKIDVNGSIDANGKTFSLSIKDDGKGMNEKELEQIFKPFYQASGNKPGTGIGLSIVKGYVEAHHGMINVTSVPNEGSDFIFTIPVAQDICAEKDNKTADNSISDSSEKVINTIEIKEKKSTILIVDDNEDMLSFLSDSLKDIYTTVTAIDGIKALEYLKDHVVSMIISDWMMPRMDGIEFCKAVRDDERISHIPFVLLTAKTDTTSKVTGMNCGADLYIEKPFSPQYLCACISNLIDMRNRLRKTFS